MKIGLIQTRFCPGDIEGNTNRVVAAIEKNPADLFLISPSALTGAFFDDYARFAEFAGAMKRALKRVLAALEGKRAILFLQEEDQSLPSCLLLEKGKVRTIPMEVRYDSAEEDQLLLMKGTCTIDSEDYLLFYASARKSVFLPLEPFFSDSQFCTSDDSDLDDDESDFGFDEARSRLDQCYDTIIFSSLPWKIGIDNSFEQACLDLGNQYGGTVYVVQDLGVSDGYVFPGRSLVAVDGGRRIACRLADFHEDCRCISLKTLPKGIDEGQPIPPMQSTWRALVFGTRAFVQDCGSSRALVGVSGGIDSAMVLAIACEALGPENVFAVLMPSPFTSQESLEDARELVARLGVTAFTLPIDSLMETVHEVLKPALDAFPAYPSEVTFENAQARIRGLLLTTLANRAQALVLNTSNLSETAMGYSTLYGDTVGALAVIGDLFKTTIYDLAQWYQKNAPTGQTLPERILTKAPSAELKPGQKDSDTLPPYEVLDLLIEKVLLHQPLSEEGLSVRKRMMQTEFKRRQEPLALKVNWVSLSSWRVPVNGRFCPGC